MLHLFLLIRKNQELFSPPNFVFSALWFFQWRTGSGGFILVIPNQYYSFPRPLDSGKIEFCPSSSLLRNQSFEYMVHSFLFVSSRNWEFGFFSLLHYGMLGTVKVKVAQPCPTLCDPMDYTIHGILQASTLEWVAFPFSRGSSQPRNQTVISCIADGFFTNWAFREAHAGNRGCKEWMPKFSLLLHCSWFHAQLHTRVS